MKKRLLSFLLVLAMIVTLLPPVFTQAADVETVNVPQFSQWATEDLIAGDNYGIYPKSWYESGMTKPITDSQLQILIMGIRQKINNTESITKELDYYFNIDDNLTVKNVLNHLYEITSSYEYSKDLGLKKKYSPIAYMEEYGIYTGAEEELKLSDLCTVEQACVFATRLITHIYDTLDAGSKGFLWEINSGENKVYLLGSIHLASYDIYPYSKKIRQAMENSDQVALELNILDPNGPSVLLDYGMYQDGSTLIDHVSKETYDKTIYVADALGIPEEIIIYYKPWMIYNMFSSFSSNDSNLEDATTAAMLGIDMNVTVRALLNGQAILEVEGYDAQAKVFDSFSNELDEYLLNSTLDTILDMSDTSNSLGKYSLDLMLSLWRKGDVETFRKMFSIMDEIINFDTDEVSESEIKLIDEYYAILITQRDIKMADYIDDLLQSETKSTTMVVVGSLHYISDYSVLDILLEKGYEINQIK